MSKSSILKKQKSNQPPSETSSSPKASIVNITRQCLGIDVSKEELKVCFKEEDIQKNTRIKGQTAFTNSPAGWGLIKKYVERFRKISDVTFLVVMEATGVYHEGLAYFLKDHQIPCSVVVPNKSKNYAKSLGIKTKNDKVDAQTLAQMGLDQKLILWKGLDPTMLAIKRVLREKEALQKQIVMLKNQFHARVHAFNSDAKSQKRTTLHVEFIEDQIEEIDTQSLQLLDADSELKSKVKKICTIKGVGLSTALIVIAEANAFELFENKAQVVSYAGYDVIQSDSGTSVHKKT
jgi:transposase